jgi:hypothetical protein
VVKEWLLPLKRESVRSKLRAAPLAVDRLPISQPRNMDPALNLSGIHRPGAGLSSSKGSGRRLPFFWAAPPALISRTPVKCGISTAVLCDSDSGSPPWFLSSCALWTAHNPTPAQDRQISQTLKVSPAEPGDFLWSINHLPDFQAPHLGSRHSEPRLRVSALLRVPRESCRAK